MDDEWELSAHNLLSIFPHMNRSSYITIKLIPIKNATITSKLRNNTLRLSIPYYVEIYEDVGN